MITPDWPGEKRYFEGNPMSWGANQLLLGPDFGQGKIPKLPKIPKKDDLDVQRAALEARQKLQASRGRRSTILTGGGGDTSQITAQRKTLLGA